MTVDIPADALFVPTDEHGRQIYEGVVTSWSLPEVRASGETVPGRPVAAPAEGLRLLDLDGLLDELGARIFFATRHEGGGELVGETAWSLREAALFALDCAAHVLETAGSASPEISSTLTAVVTAARKWLSEVPGADTGLLGRFSRLAVARRLRRQGRQVGGLAFNLAIDAEAADRDLLDDPDWTAVAATRDAVLAAVEAVRHDGGARLGGPEGRRREERPRGAEEVEPTQIETPWGPWHPGMHAGTIPAFLAAGEAAERARRSVEDASGPEAARAERAWQRDRLLVALRGG